MQILGFLVAAAVAQHYSAYSNKSHVQKIIEPHICEVIATADIVDQMCVHVCTYGAIGED